MQKQLVITVSPEGQTSLTVNGFTSPTEIIGVMEQVKLIVLAPLLQQMLQPQPAIVPVGAEALHQLRNGHGR